MPFTVLSRFYKDNNNIEGFISLLGKIIEENMSEAILHMNLENFCIENNNFDQAI